MGRQISKPDTFEAVLERGRRGLAEAREEYAALEGTDSVPERLVEAIADLKRELDELDRTLEVTDDDIELAEETARRVALLSGVLSALRERQRTVVEAEVRRLDHHVSTVTDLVREHDLEDRTERHVDELEREHSMLTRLVESERYGQVETGDRISLEGLEEKLREVTFELEGEVPDAARATAYLDACDRLLDDVHDALGDLNERNRDRTAHREELRTVKERIEAAETALGTDDPDAAASDAHRAFEKCLVLHLETARARGRQFVAARLADTVVEFDVSVDCDVEGCVERGDPETLLGAITDAVTSAVERSTAERLGRLLREHDGSVVRTAESTDFEVAAILEHVEQLHDDGAVDDVVVEFSR